MFPLTAEICEQARRSRDPRFDGRFYIGVLTTGIYCRPICPARTAAPDNVRYFPAAAAAEDAGFRACLRCRPERAPRVPEWSLASDLVQRGLRLIDAGFLDERSSAQLAERLGVSARHLDRRFHEVLGTTPQRLARTRRLHLARELLLRSRLPMQQVALQAGYGSLRRFNAEIRSSFECTPSALRRSGGGAVPGEPLKLELPLRAPYHRQWVLDFHQRRALPLLERVVGDRLERRLQGSGEHWLAATLEADRVLVELPVAALLNDLNTADLLSQVRRVLDLDADSTVIDAALAGDEELGPQVARTPGLRVPGAWDGFEIAVRAILGQQVSVARARDLAVALIERFGAGAFPSPAALADADVAAIGMPGRRGAAVRALAAAVLDGKLRLDDAEPAEALKGQLVSLPGIGPWTAGYVAMRVGRDPDAFPEADWVVLKQLKTTAARARKVAGRWRPWRAYALMYLWARSAQFGHR
ncbi:MAG: Ada metal-binding domain-containing protein [Pseudomonadota bacterium]